MSIRRVAALGENNEEVLREVGGLSPEEIQELARAGVISTSPRSGEAAP